MLTKLLNNFDSQEKLPIEVPEVAEHLISFGVQDNIIFSGEDSDPGKIRGVFYQYTTSPGVYSPPDLVTLIVYSNNVPVEWQRLICCKELIHSCDAHLEKTNTEEEVSDLLDKLLGPLSTEDYGLADLMAAVDKLALYRALAILFPLAARKSAKTAVQNGEKTVEEIAKWAVIPKSLIDLALSDGWSEIKLNIFDCKSE